MFNILEQIWIDELAIPSSDKEAGTYYLTDDDDRETLEYIHKRRLDAAIARTETVEAEVKRLREALQLYAGGDWTGHGIAWEPIDDKGAVARAALSTDATE